jgi:GNAT superfamily N-acetyltransferase
MVEVRAYTDLTAEERALAPLIDASDGGLPSNPERIDRIRFAGRPFQEYESLYAIDEGIPLSRVGWIRVPFRSSRSSQVVCGLADVVTRADAMRRGLATLLVEEAHRRARAQGLRWSFLWTRRSWGSHRAYEKIGYRDVYSPSVALHRTPARSEMSGPPSGWSVRAARTKDADLLEKLLSSSTHGRIGFLPRTKGWFEARFKLGWRRPSEFRIFTYRRRAVGYAQVAIDRSDLISRELVVTRSEFARPVLDHLEAMARGRWIVFGSTTFVRDEEPELERRKYRVLRWSHGTLMACPLNTTARSEWAEVRRTMASHRLSLHAGDMI